MLLTLLLVAVLVLLVAVPLQLLALAPVSVRLVRARLLHRPGMGFALAVVELTGVELELEPLVPRSHRRCVGPEARTLPQHGERRSVSFRSALQQQGALKRSRQENASQVCLETARWGENYVMDRPE